MITRHLNARGSSWIGRREFNVWVKANCERLSGIFRIVLWEWDSFQIGKAPRYCTLGTSIKKKSFCPGISLNISPWVSPYPSKLIISSWTLTPASPQLAPPCMPPSCDRLSTSQRSSPCSSTSCILQGKSFSSNLSSSPAPYLYHCLITSWSLPSKHAHRQLILHIQGVFLEHISGQVPPLPSTLLRLPLPVG